MTLIKFLNIFNDIDKTNNFTGLNYTGIQNIETIKKGIGQYISSDKNIEVLIHPGHTNLKEKEKFNKKYFKYYSSSERLREFEIVSLENFVKDLLI